MNIGIDARILSEKTIAGEYSKNLLFSLLPLDKEINFRIFSNGFCKDIKNFRWVNSDNIKLIDFKIPNKLFSFETRYFNFPKIDKIIGGADVYFSPSFFPAPVSKKCRKVVAFHSLSLLRCPEHFSYKKRFYYKFFSGARKEAMEADKIIALSQSTKDDLVELYNIGASKIEVIYPGVEEIFKPTKKEKNIFSVKKKYKLPGKYILYLGDIKLEKNVVGLIKAFNLLKEKYGMEESLVIAGVDECLDKKIIEEMAISKYSNEIFLTGPIDYFDKPFIYGLSRLLIYPSFYEGFAFSPLEAMACGVPVITSNNSSLPESVDSAALMINPYDIGEMAWVVKTVLENDRLRGKMIQAGLEQVKNFSWEECAKKTLQLLKQTL